jgi:hypothetical protein
MCCKENKLNNSKLLEINNNIKSSLVRKFSIRKVPQKSVSFSEDEEVNSIKRFSSS